eukprot:112543_1
MRKEMTMTASVLSFSLLLYSLNAVTISKIPSCDIRDYGAIGDNKTINTQAIISTITDCHNKYGNNSLVLINIPSGIYVTGSFNLTSNTILYLNANVTIAGSTNPSDYALCECEPCHKHQQFMYCPLIASFNATNISIIGNDNFENHNPYLSLSNIDGRGAFWWNNTLNYTQPQLIEFVNCSNINIMNITVYNSSMWTIHPLLCNNTNILNVNIFSPRYQGGISGINPDSCNEMYMYNVYIDVGDDAIAVQSLKSDFPSQNILMENIQILSRNFAIGSGVMGGIENITLKNSIIGDKFGSSPWAIKIKPHRGLGGYIHNILFENLTFGNIAPNTWQQSNGGYDIMFDPSYGTSTIPLYPAANVSNIIFRNITGYKDVTAGHLIGLNESIWNNIMFENVVLNNSKNGWKCQFVNVISNGIVEPHFPADCLQ